MTVVVRSRVADGVELVELDDPGRYNVLTVAMVAELRDTFAELRDDRAVRVVIITGRGKGFCAGANMTGDDVTPPEAQDRGPVGSIHFIQDNLAQLMLAIHELPQPVIAAVHGAAVGGGLAIALSCDLRVASDDASFGAQFIRVGLSACDVGSSYWLPRVVGPTIAAELMLTGRRFSAEEALRFGMLNRVVARDALLDQRRRARGAHHRQQRVRRLHDQARHVGQPRRAEPAPRDGAREPHPGARHLHPQHDRSRPRLRREARPHLEPALAPEAAGQVVR